jgi:hypothetical protein
MWRHMPSELLRVSGGCNPGITLVSWKRPCLKKFVACDRDRHEEFQRLGRERLSCMLFATPACTQGPACSSADIRLTQLGVRCRWITLHCGAPAARLFSLDSLGSLFRHGMCCVIIVWKWLAVNVAHVLGTHTSIFFGFQEERGLSALAQWACSFKCLAFMRCEGAEVWRKASSRGSPAMAGSEARERLVCREGWNGTDEQGHEGCEARRWTQGCTQGRDVAKRQCQGCSPEWGPCVGEDVSKREQPDVP